MSSERGCWPERGRPALIVEAAGGVVCRPGPAGLTEIAVIHRPGLDDWSLPKGKLEVGETHEVAALREVEEETGLRCRLVRELGRSNYTDRRGRDKVVSYWEMKPVDGQFKPNPEADMMRWVTIDEAIELLTYPRDRELVGSLPR